MHSLYVCVDKCCVHTQTCVYSVSPHMHVEPCRSPASYRHYSVTGSALLSSDGRHTSRHTRTW